MSSFRIDNLLEGSKDHNKGQNINRFDLFKSLKRFLEEKDKSGKSLVPDDLYLSMLLLLKSQQIETSINLPENVISSKKRRYSDENASPRNDERWNSFELKMDGELQTSSEEDEFNSPEKRRLDRTTFNLSPSSALDALIKMANTTMNKLVKSPENTQIHIQAPNTPKRNSSGQSGDQGTCENVSSDDSGNLLAFYSNNAKMRKRRKTRTTFSNSQISELEDNFTKQKYLTPIDRDRIARKLNLSNTQVITWFQNRRAKMKRENEELERDLIAAKKDSSNLSLTALAIPDISDDEFDSPLDSSDEGKPLKTFTGLPEFFNNVSKNQLEMNLPLMLLNNKYLSKKESVSTIHELKEFFPFSKIKNFSNNFESKTNIDILSMGLQLLNSANNS